MRDTADLAAGKSTDKSSESCMIDRLLLDDDHVRVTSKLADMLTSICDYCHERLGNLVSANLSENEKEKSVIDTSLNKNADKESSNWNDKSWLSERATTAQVCKLANIVEHFTETCEKLCGKQCITLRCVFKVYN
jgi:vacuolar protein sorting-associated protein 54